VPDFEVAIGIAVLLAAKFLAYAWYLRLLGRRWNVSRNPWLLAFARMLLGAGLAAIVWNFLPSGRDTFLGTYFFALAGGRVLAWGLILGFAFGNRARPMAIALALVPAVVLSYLVEIPILLGLVSAVGIC
jgi:hypothetical protein